MLSFCLTLGQYVNVVVRGNRMMGQLRTMETSNFRGGPFWSPRLAFSPCASAGPEGAATRWISELWLASSPCRALSKKHRCAPRISHVLGRCLELV